MINKHEPAFAAMEEVEQGGGLEAPKHIFYKGLTKLEFASIEAMKALLANPNLMEKVDGYFRLRNEKEIAQLSRFYADALLTELEHHKKINQQS